MPEISKNQRNIRIIELEIEKIRIDKELYLLSSDNVIVDKEENLVYYRRLPESAC